VGRLKMYLDGIFDLIDIIKKRFRKKSTQQELDQELDEYLDSEMPGELDRIAEYSKGIHTEDDFEKLRKNL
jgi:hypothetical protein